MATSMTPNYANLFMDNFEQNFVRHHFQETGLSVLVWFRFLHLFLRMRKIDDKNFKAMTDIFTFIQ